MDGHLEKELDEALEVEGGHHRVRLILLLEDVLVDGPEHLEDILLGGLQAVDLEVFEHPDGLPDDHVLVLALELLEGLLDCVDRARGVGVLVKDQLEDLEVLLHKESDGVLVLLLLKSQVEQLVFLQLLENAFLRPLVHRN